LSTLLCHTPVDVQVAANHALGDVWAMGGVPTSALAIAAVPLMSEAAMEAELSDMMRGALKVCAPDGELLSKRDVGNCWLGYQRPFCKAEGVHVFPEPVALKHASHRVPWEIRLDTAVPAAACQ
jgi:hypothetical protein